MPRQTTFRRKTSFQVGDGNALLDVRAGFESSLKVRLHTLDLGFELGKHVVASMTSTSSSCDSSVEVTDCGNETTRDSVCELI